MAFNIDVYSYHKILVASFINETRFQQIENESMAELEDPRGFNANETTIACSNVFQHMAVQVVPSSVRLISLETMECVAEWVAEGTCYITHAYIQGTQVLLALSGGDLDLLAIHKDSLELKG
jgi:Mono-functional DNA-alkylating methyl methanesulfonate N-term